MKANPFFNRRPVYGADFFGRENDLEYLLDMTLGKVPQSVSIVSSERMGASSLLLHYYKVAGPARKKDATFIYLDLQAIHSCAGFFQKILTCLGEKGNTSEALSDVISKKKNQYIIICLDHFDKTLTKPEEFNADFFDFMRSLISADYCLAYIIVTTTPLKDLNIPHAEGSSPLKNIFQSHLTLRPWNISEQRKFIQDKFAKTEETITDTDLDFILNNGHKSPYHLIVLLDHYYRARQSGFVNRGEILNAYQKDVEGVSPPRPKPKPLWLLRHLWQMVFGAITLLVVLWWFVYGLPRANSAYQCLSPGIGNIHVLIEHPKYLAIGDVGMLNITITNTSSLPLTPAVVVINFNEPVQLLSENSNRFEAKKLDNGEQHSFELKFWRSNNANLELSVQSLFSGKSVQCTAVPSAYSDLVQTVPIPYFMTFWIWLGTTGPIAWLAPLIVDWLKKRL